MNQLKIEVRNNSLHVEGYVNAVERPSKTMYMEGKGDFQEIVKEGTFKRALKKNPNIVMLLNHDSKKVIAEGENLELYEDNIGLKVKANINDPNIKELKNKFVGWSFGFKAIKEKWTTSKEGIQIRELQEIELNEVSLLTTEQEPAYKGTEIEIRSKRSDTKMNNLKGLKEKLNDMIQEVNEKIENAEETRALNGDEEKELNDLMTRVEEMKTRIEELESKKNEDVKEGEEMQKQEENKNSNTEEVRSFERFLRTGETRGITATSNGAIVGTEIANMVIDQVKEICPILEKCTMFNVKGKIQIPKGVELTADYMVAGTDLADGMSDFGSVNLDDFVVGALALVPRNLINNAGFDIVSYVVKQMAKALAIKLEKELLIGTTSKATGAVSTTKSVSLPKTTTTTGALADALIDMQAEMPQVYSNTACWVMNKDTLKAVRKLKNNNGDYLLQTTGLIDGFKYELLGNPVYVSQSMDAYASGKAPVLFIEMTGMACKLVNNIEVEILREKYASSYQVGIVGFAEFDCDVMDDQRVIKGVVAAA